MTRNLAEDARRAERQERAERDALRLARKISAFTPYGEGEGELADNEDAALVLNALITEASAVLATYAGTEA